MPTAVAPLEIYPLRKIWTDEARDFTPWLARPENLARALGLGPLQFEAKEQPIGDFSLDILARDPLGHRVVIENQLEPSDHRHLGQLLTYAAGTDDGLTVIWIASSIRREHGAALKWLNAMTPTHIGFFGVEITAWSITGGDEPGYQFPLTDEQAEYQEYWAAFQEELRARSAEHWLRPALPRSAWYGRNVGRPGFNFYAILKPKDSVLAVMLEIATPNHDADFAALGADRNVINSELGGAPQWTSTGARDYISTELQNADFRDREKWPAQHAWLIEQLESYRLAFTSRITALRTSGQDYQTDPLSVPT
jgi:hypothetical protein